MNMNGWDTVYAVSTARTNAALSAAGALLPSIETTVQGTLGSIGIAAVFAPWQIVSGGSGELIHMVLPITSGSITLAGSSAIAIDGLQPVMQVSLRWSSAGGGTNDSQQLVFDLQTAGQMGGASGTGIVLPFGFLEPPALDPELQPMLLNGLATVIVANAARIGFALASINPINPGSPGWLAPQNCAFLYFETGAAPAGYLAILSAANPPASPVMTVDPSLVAGGATAGYAVSLPLYLSNVTLPGILLGLPGSSSGQFIVNTSPPSLELRSGQSASLGSDQVAAITYYPKLTSLSLTPGVGEMTVSAQGECDLYGKCSMTFSVTAANPFVFNAAQQSCAFTCDHQPTVHHDTSVPWWYLVGGAMAYIIANTVSTIVSSTVTDLVGNQIAAGTLLSAPPGALSFSGMNSFDAAAVTLNGAIVMQTSTEPTGSPARFFVREKQYA